MPQCAICLQDRGRLKFRTGRLSICSYCVKTLNTTELSPRIAETKWCAKLREATLAAHPDGASWVDGWVGRKLASAVDDAKQVRRSPELKVLRAYRRSLICADRQTLDYPKNWDFKRYRLKHWHGYACYRCKKLESPATMLDAHHIIHLTNCGTNNYANLVILCRGCHQKEHPSIDLAAIGGEVGGQQSDPSIESDDVLALPETEWGDIAPPILAITRSQPVPLPQTVTLRSAPGSQTKPPPPSIWGMLLVAAVWVSAIGVIIFSVFGD